uniref:coiled-coil domain-containing protein 149-B-like n=1 Tax=Styela clava TaxID=7725 RepID=UPI00193A387E|nr:coiled-coil domain-containing protein 149-B-like [Styela clava]
MDRRRRTEADWLTLVSELQALKRKLTSKSEALLILSKDLESTQKERDQFKLMAEKLRVRCQAYKRQFSDYPLTRDQASLIQMLRDTKNQKVAQQKQCEVLQLKLNEALGDVKLLRERFARQRIGDEGIGPRHFPAHEREELVVQLESEKQQAEQYRQELNIANDQVTELSSERDEFRLKAERLNNELNFMLNGDKKRIIDIDALCMENKYLQERVKQCQEEKNSLHSQMGKLKAVLNARKATNTDIQPGKIRNSGLVISPKQVKEILMNRAGLPTSAENVSDLQSIAAALLETINDKNLALHHLRNTNKILGNRVAELERKLRTLEVVGLWSTNGQTPSLSSTPKIKTEDESSNLTPTSANNPEDEFLSSLGSRLSKLTDVCARSFEEYKLVSLTPESSGSVSDAAKSGDATPLHNGATELSEEGTHINVEKNFTHLEDGATNVGTDATCAVHSDTEFDNDALTSGDTEQIDNATFWTSCASELNDDATNLSTDSSKNINHESNSLTGVQLNSDGDTSLLHNGATESDHDAMGIDTSATNTVPLKVTSTSGISEVSADNLHSDATEVKEDATHDKGHQTLPSSLDFDSPDNGNNLSGSATVDDTAACDENAATKLTKNIDGSTDDIVPESTATDTVSDATNASTATSLDVPRD